jgi:predicted transcriptional regulator
MTSATSPELLTLTAQIVSAHVSNNSVTPDALPDLINSIYGTLSTVGTTPTPPAAEKPQPAVPIKRSVFPDHIVCLEDGKKLKMLKRHLKTAYNMTPEEYREKWRLPSSYPMVAPNYAEQRSTLAKSIGLGRRPAEVVPEPEPVAPPVPPARRGRPPKQTAAE